MQNVELAYLFPLRAAPTSLAENYVGQPF